MSRGESLDCVTSLSEGHLQLSSEFPHSHCPASGFHSQDTRESHFYYPVTETNSKISFSKKILNSTIYLFRSPQGLERKGAQLWRKGHGVILPQKESLWLLVLSITSVFGTPNPSLFTPHSSNTTTPKKFRSVIHSESEIKRKRTWSLLWHPPRALEGCGH